LPHILTLLNHPLLNVPSVTITAWNNCPYQSALSDA
jgi:hypothetical protein